MVDAVKEGVTVEVFLVVSLLPLTVIVVMVLPSGDTTVLVCENSFLLIFFSYFIILKHTVFEFISGAKYSKYTVPDTGLLISEMTSPSNGSDIIPRISPRSTRFPISIRLLKMPDASERICLVLLSSIIFVMYPGGVLALTMPCLSRKRSIA